MKKGVLLFVGIVLALISAFSIYSSPKDKMDYEIDEFFGDKGEMSVIVVLKDDYGFLESSALDLEKDEFERKKIMIAKQQERVLDSINEEKQRKSKLNLLRKDNYSFRLKRQYTTINGFSGSITREGYEELMKNPNVKKIYPNQKVYALLNDTKVMVNATNTWRLIYNGTNLTGKGQTVCIIDTGIDYTHSDLGECSSTSNINDGSCAKVVGGYDFVNSDENPADDHGHGTHVAGIVASTNGTYRGIAPDAAIVAIKALDSAGEGNFADVDSGIDWCVNNATLFNITVISMSLGTKSPTLFSGHCDDSYSTTATAIDNAISKNISVIVAAGNEGSTTQISSPACIYNSTAVSAVNKSDSPVNNRNNLTDIVAPGVNIISTARNGGTESNSGTSMSTPHVSGAFALINQYIRLTQNRAATPNETYLALNDTGAIIDDGTGSGFNFSRINIFEAIKQLDTGAPRITMLSPLNNTARTNLTFLVVINSSEVLSNATLEINNTNFTMSGSGTSWNANVSNLTNATYTYRVYGNDTFANSNVSETFTVHYDLFSPYWSVNITNATDMSALQLNDAVQFNITWNDTVELSWYIFSWNDTGSWENLTNGSLSGKTQILSINKTINSTRAAVVGFKFYANDTANNKNETDLWTFSIANTIPQAVNVTINSTEHLNRTNGTIQGFFSFTDSDSDTLSDNESKWYNNSVEYNVTANLTSLSAQNTTKGQNWTFSARVYDGFDWSNWVNSTKITIENARPEINITIDNATVNIIGNITVNETQSVNITANASDTDNDALTFTSNDTSFSLSGIYFLWSTELTDSGTYSLNVTVNDTEDIDSKIVTVFVLDARDLDSDGNPDFNDTDDDDDGIDDASDFLVGNVSSVNTTLIINISVNGTANLSRLYNESLWVNITNGSDIIVEFNFTFNNSNVLDLGKLTINRTVNGSSAVSIRGLSLKTINKTKTVFLEKLNTTVNAVCIKDIDIAYENISSACNEGNETLLNCNNQTSNGYACFDTGTRYKVTGLNHSAVKELCRDVDGDKYGTGCANGNDCDDNDASKNTDCSSGSSGSSSGGGGGGGGGGGAPTATAAAGPATSKLWSVITPDSPAKMAINEPKIAISEIEFEVYEEANSVELKVEKLDSNPNPESSKPGDAVYQYFEITASNLENTNIKLGKIDFKVPKAWIAQNNAEEPSVTLYRFSGAWNPLHTVKISDDTSNVFYQSTTNAFSSFAIGAKKKTVAEPLGEANITMNESVFESNGTEEGDKIEEILAEPEEEKSNTAIVIVIIAVLLASFISIILIVWSKMSKKMSKDEGKKKK